jgi:hypothetical protein
LHPPSPDLTARRARWVRLALPLALAAGASLAGQLPTEIDRALHRQQSDAKDLSLYVRDVTEPEPRVAFDLDTPRAPASTIKPDS